ncbi:MAG: diguanylate cyclase/phosphodiesterase with and sensor(s) [Acidimicrobiales bacterium]|nr:diguanylate cyclase/phosphodiesterase with and sensor(s) [Acidimicrobiales bacterium]
MVATPPPRAARSFQLRLDRRARILPGSIDVFAALGLHPDAIQGMRMHELMHRDDIAGAMGAWTDLIALPDRSQSTRVRLRDADGSWRWFASTAWNSLADPDQASILSEFHDIQAVVEAEQLLHDRELGYRTLAESMPVGVALLDEAGLVHFANHRLVSLLTHAGLLGPIPDSIAPLRVGSELATRWTDLVDPRFAAEIAELLRQLDGGNAGSSRLVRLTALDGETVNLWVKVVTVDHATGQHVIVTVQDVTEQTRTGQAHDRLVQVVDEIDELVIVSDLTGTVSYMNNEAERYFGDDLLGRPLLLSLPPALQAFATAQILPSLERLERWAGDVEVLDLDGVAHLMATSARPVAGPEPGQYHVGITMRDVTAERAHARELASQARRDPLTGLPNRTALMEQLESTRATGSGDDHVALCFIDLDNLKIINDGLGHGAGDRLLTAVADELRRAAHPLVVTRFGGDEFVVVCEGQDATDAMATAERLLDAVRKASVPGVASHLSASLGVATTRRRSLDPEGLVRDADTAMYAAKRGGRGRCALFDETLRQRVRRRFELEAAMRDALADGTIDVHLQPVVRMDDGLISGVEALCRWSAATPAEFVPVAEDSGLIVPLGRRVLQRTLEAGSILRASAPGLDQVRIGCNVSGRELDEPGYAARTLEIIEANSVPPEHVVLELTESVLIDPRDEVDQCLRQLRDAGVALALDDFGVGYSSLSYLRRYPIELLKLDVSYTQAATTDPGTRVIVEAMVSMATRLGLGVVAEGVETPEQLATIRELGVTWGQGYLMGRPAPVEDLLALDLARPLVELPTPR